MDSAPASSSRFLASIKSVLIAAIPVIVAIAAIVSVEFAPSEHGRIIDVK